MNLTRLLSILWLPVFVALIAAFIDYFKISETLDDLLYDSAQLLATEVVPQDIVIVAIDEQSILELGRWPWSRDKHAKLVSILEENKVAAIGFDVIFSDPDETSLSSDVKFSRQLELSGNVVLPVHMEQLNQHGQILELLPAPQFFEMAAAVGHVHVELDKDGVCRSVFLKEGLNDAYWSHFTVALQNVVSPDNQSLSGIRNNETIPHSMSRIARDFHNLIPFRFPVNSFSTISYIDVLKGIVPQSSLEGKIIMVGATATGLTGDEILTPIGSMPGVELNAYIFHAFRENTFISTTSHKRRAVVSSLITLLVVISLSGMAPRLLSFATMISGISIVTISLLLLSLFEFWFPPSSSVLAIGLFYPLYSWRRLETTLAYLRRELASLQIKGINEFHQSSLEQVTLGINYLAQVLPVADWRIYNVNNNNWKLLLSKEPVTEREDLSVNESIIKYNESTHLNERIFFSDNDNSYVLDVLWKDIYGKRFGSLVSQLVSIKQENMNIPGWGVGLVEHTIEELNMAKGQVEDKQVLIHQTLAQLNESVIVADICGRVMFINTQAEEHLGYRDTGKEDLISVLEPIKFSNDMSWLDVIKALMESREAFSCEGQLDSPKVDFICQGSLLKIKSDEPDTIIITLSDISQLKKTERDRREALDFLSHDLQAPMISVLSIIDQERLRGISDNRSKLLNHIETHIKKNLGYAENFLQLNRAENISEASFSLCDMHAVMDSAIFQTINLAKAKKIAIKSDKTKTDTWVLGNGDLLERAITNLLTNAIKYTDTQSDIVAQLDVEKGFIHVSIIDNGKGIAENEIDTLFDSYERGSNQNQKGTGIGLYFTKVVAQKHHGHIVVRSKLGEGTTVILSLPVFEE